MKLISVIVYKFRLNCLEKTVSPPVLCIAPVQLPPAAAKKTAVVFTSSLHKRPSTMCHTTAFAGIQTATRQGPKMVLELGRLLIVVHKAKLLSVQRQFEWHHLSTYCFS